MNNRKLLALLLCLTLAAGLLSGCQPKQEEKDATPAGRYDEAIALLQADRFADAAEAFEALGHYSDATQNAMYCRALNSANNGAWDTAVATLTTLGDFRDSRILAAYYQARALEASGQYEAAAAVYGGLLQFGDVSARVAALPGLILARDYEAADALEQAGELERALAAFRALGEYSDSPARAEGVQDLINARDYEAADALEQAGELERALAAFQALGEYSDSPARAAGVQARLDQIAHEKLEKAYVAAESLEAADDIVAAYDAFIALGAYRDSASRAAALKPEADYRSAFAAAEKGNYAQAQRMYAGLGDYKDAPEKARLLLIWQKAESGAYSRLAGGVYAYRINGLYGFIDLNNNRDLAPQWRSIGVFSDAQLAIAGVDSGYLLIDLRGREASPVYYSLNRRGQYYAAGTRRGYQTTYSILDARGTVLSSGWSEIGTPAEGLAPVKRASDGRWGYVDAGGNTAIEPQYESAKAFAEGVAPVKANKHWFYIDKNNAVQLTLGADIADADSFSGSLALVRSGVYGTQVIDKTGGLVLFKENVYQAAARQADQGRFEDAIALYESLNGYADSADQAVQAREKINQQVYARAEAYLEKGMLAEAAETFEWLGEYSDAAGRAADAREMIRANTYAKAQELEKAGKPEEAIGVYQSLGDYRDSAKRAVDLRNGINRGILEQAESLFADGRKLSALDMLLPIADWEDTAARMAEMYTSYLQDGIDAAGLLEDAENYEGAIAVYREIAGGIKGNRDYFESMRQDPAQEAEFERLAPLYELLEGIEVGSDTEERIAAATEKMHERDYKAAAAMEDAKQYEKAIAAFTALGGWGDAAERAAGAQAALEAYRKDYRAAAALEQELKLEDAVAAFRALGAFEDAAGRADKAQVALEEYRRAYAAADALETEEKYEEAIEAFRALTAFSDAAGRIPVLEGKILARDYARADRWRRRAGLMKPTRRLSPRAITATARSARCRWRPRPVNRRTSAPTRPRNSWNSSSSTGKRQLPLRRWETGKTPRSARSPLKLHWRNTRRIILSRKRWKAN